MSVVDRDVRNRLFYFGSVCFEFLTKNSDSVRHEFGSVRFGSVQKTRFCSEIIVIYYSCNSTFITATVDDMTLTSLTTTTTSK